MYETHLLSGVVVVLFLLIFMNSYRLNKYKKQHITTTIVLDDKVGKTTDKIDEIMSHVNNEDNEIKDRIQNNLVKLNAIDSKLQVQQEFTAEKIFENIDDSTLDSQFETSLDKMSFEFTKPNDDVKSHFLYTDVSEENSLYIKSIENQISNLSDKIESLQNNLNNIQYVNE